MSDARKRKLQASLSKSTDLPESLKFVPSKDPPTNGPHTKKQKTDNVPQALPRDYELGLFNLQVTQLLQTMNAERKGNDESAKKLVESVIKKINAIPDTEPMNLAKVRSLSKQTGIEVPFTVQPPEETQLPFQYLQPADTSVTAPELSPAIARTDLSITEICVELPSEVLQEKDYLNDRANFKMAFYLYYIASHLKSKYTLRFEEQAFMGSLRKVLCVVYKDRQVIIHVTLPSDAFEESKLLPSKNAHRSTAEPTPQYNNGLLLRMRHSMILEMLTNANNESPGFRNSVLLAKRFLLNRISPIATDQWALLVAALLTGGGKNGGKILSPNASALQLFRGTVLFLSHFFEKDMNSVSFGEPREAPGCWIRGVNIFACLTEQERIYLSYRLNIFMKLLTDENRDPVRSFEKVFLDEDPPVGSFDLEIRIPSLPKSSLDPERIWRTLKRALDNRVIILLVRDSTTVDLLHTSEAKFLSIGMMIDHERSQTPMILGPPANSTEAKSFQGLWGGLAELRKFKDGRILESVSLSRLNPTIDACKKILELHFPGLPSSDSWKCFGGDRDEEALSIQQQKTLFGEFEEFARLARELDDLPLRILSLSSSSSLTSATAIDGLNVIDGVIQFESSARWPDDLEAIQRTKVAFLLALVKPFSTVAGVSSAQVGLENQSSTSNEQTSDKMITNIGVLEVCMSSGTRYCFRIHHDREKTLLKIFLNSASAKNDIHLRRQYQEALELYEETYITNESHRQLIRSFTSRFLAFPASTILLKKWFSAHLLQNQFSDRVIELLALNCFINDADYIVQSPCVAFVRTMQFLASWDWRLDPLILSEEPVLYKEHAEAFSKAKAQQSGHSILIYGPSDAPIPVVEKVAALRMTSLAKATYNSLQAGETVESTMRTPLHHFDLVLTLHIDRSADTKYRNLASTATPSDLSRATKLLKQELARVYGQALYFFTSEEEHKIGVLIDPALHKPRKFRPNLGYPSRPEADSEDSRQVVLDIDAVVEELARLGEGIIKRIDRKKTM